MSEKILLSIASCCLISIATNIKHSQQGALAFVTPLTRRKSRMTSAIFGTEGAESQLEESSTSSKDAIYDAHFREYIDLYGEHGDIARREDLGSLLSVCREVQNSPDYQPAEWADACKVFEQQGENIRPTVIASRDAKKGDVLTLFPIHALGLSNNIDGAEYNEFSSEKHEQLYEAGDAVRLNVPLNRLMQISKIWDDPAATVVGKNPGIRMFTISFPGEEVIPGWLGGVIQSTSVEEEANCINLPLWNASPFYAIVATRDIKEGDELIRATETSDWDLWEKLKDIIFESQTKGLLALRNHIRKAFVGSFHQINLDYPGLKKIHSDPDIYEIENFLTDDECDRMIAKIRPNLENQVVGYKEREETWVGNDDKSYMSVEVPAREIPTIINKLTTLANCSKDSVGHTHCLHYEMGKMQKIIPHVDLMEYPERELFAGHTNGRSKHTNDGRSKTFHSWAIVFCYLNDVGNGGATYFNSIDLHVTPTKGTGLIHLCADLDGRPDTRTMHEGSPAIDEKWLIAMTLYNTTDITHEFLEFRLDPLSNDVI